MKKILTGWMLLTAFITFSQSDQLDFSMAFVTNPAFTAGLDETSAQGEIFQVSVSMNQEELDSLGTFLLLIYDLPTSFLIFETHIDREEILNGIYTHNGQLVFSFPNLDPDKAYKVILNVQNMQQAYLPHVEKNFPTN
ncbi:hypothetical protein D3C87_84730 [compost metagenome]